MKKVIGHGLLNSLSEEEGRELFIADWIDRHHHEFSFLEKLTKKELIELILFPMAKRSIDQEKHGGLPVLMPIQVGMAIHKKSPEEARQIIEEWRDAEVADAGSNTRRAVEVAEIAGMALDRVKTRKYLDFKKHPDGRRKGNQSMKTSRDEAEEHYRPIIKDILIADAKKSDTHMSDNAIAKHILKTKHPPKHERGQTWLRSFVAEVRKELPESSQNTA